MNTTEVNYVFVCIMVTMIAVIITSQIRGGKKTKAPFPLIQVQTTD